MNSLCSRALRRRPLVVGGVLMSLAAAGAAEAEAAPEPSWSDHALPTSGVDAKLARITALLQAQDARLRSEEAQLANQARQIEQQRAEIAVLRAGQVANVSAPPSSSGEAMATATPPTSETLSQNADLAPPAGLPSKPVGEAPETNVKPIVLSSIPQNLGVLTPRGHFVLEPDIEYDRIGSNRLVFQGVEIVPGLQLGLVQANTVADDLVAATADIRYGVTSRFELELRVPYLYNNDRLTTLAQQVDGGTPGATITNDIRGSGVGDITLMGRYQLNRAEEGKPVFIANLRVKSDSGTGPYGVAFSSAGIAQSLPTGSGFWGVEPGMTLLLPIDPVVLFSNVSYLHNFSRDVNKTIGSTLVGEVNPGDSVNASWGFAFAVNPQFSYSLGFTNSYIFGTQQYLNGITERSSDLEVGSLTVGFSYRLRHNLLLTSTLEFGVTPDAPNLQLVFKIPFAF